jgi:hypothetical protein
MGQRCGPSLGAGRRRLVSVGGTSGSNRARYRPRLSDLFLLAAIKARDRLKALESIHFASEPAI